MPDIRAFIALPIADSIQREISLVQDRLKTAAPEVRWEHPSKFHVTMKFLGDLSGSQIQTLRSSMGEMTGKVAPFPVRLLSAGCFPNSRSPKIVWIGSSREENRLLTVCFELIDTHCASAGFSRDERQFHPHITLGRVKGKISDSLIRKVETLTFEPLQFLCTELLVMKSDLSPSGSAYSQQFTIPLKG